MTSTKLTIRSLCVVLALAVASASAQEKAAEAPPSCLGKYPMSFFTKTRTAKPVGKNRLSTAVKLQMIDNDEVLSNGSHRDPAPGDEFYQFKVVPCAKYGWHKDAHIALGIPYIYTDFTSGQKHFDAADLGSIFLFHKWCFMKEKQYIPAMAVDAWYYLPTGDPAKKAGRDEHSCKATAEISKAWSWINVHVNPGYTWASHGPNVKELNVGTYLNLHPKFWPGVEYNYIGKGPKGHKNDIVAGLLWKFGKCSTMKLAAVVNVESSMKYRDEVGVAYKIFHKF